MKVGIITHNCLSPTMAEKYNKFFIAVLAVLTVKLSHRQCAEDGEHFSYSDSGENGPSHWGGRCNDGSEQSPIDIPGDTRDTTSRAFIYYVGYTFPVTKGQIINNGHTVQITPGDGESRGYNLGYEYFSYRLRQFHFHFGNGSDKSQGSEHTVNGSGYAMEMHFVHQSVYSSGLAVIGVFFEETSEDNEKLTPLINAVDKVKYSGDTAELSEPINLFDLFPKCRSTYYRYMGSTTTPPCQEGVTWSVLQQPVQISTEQLKAFRKQLAVTEEDSTGESDPKIAGNFRPIQPLNGRPVVLFDRNCVFI